MMIEKQECDETASFGHFVNFNHDRYFVAKSICKIFIQSCSYLIKVAHILDDVNVLLGDIPQDVLAQRRII